MVVISLGLMDHLAESMNLPVDLVKTFVLMLTSIPLSLVFRLMDKPFQRFSYSLIVGLLFTVYLLHEWTLYVLAVVIVPYVLYKSVGKYHY